MTVTASSPTDLGNTLEEMRASVAGEGARKGLAGAVQEAILKLLEVLLTLLVEFRAGRLAPLAPVAEEAPRGAERCLAGAECEGKDTPSPDLPRCAGLGREVGQRANGSGGARRTRHLRVCFAPLRILSRSERLPQRAPRTAEGRPCSRHQAPWSREEASAEALTTAVACRQTHGNSALLCVLRG